MNDLATATEPAMRMPAMAWVALSLAVGFMLGCYAAVGATLGLYFGGIVFAALLAPPLVLTDDRLVARLLIGGFVCDGIGVVWLLGLVGSHVTFLQWLMCYALLITWCFALLGVAGALRSMGTIPASAMTVLLAILWLSAPVWLLTHFPGATGWVVPAHPLFAINSVLVHLGIWTERPIAYQYLFTLGQDVPYELPPSILPAAGVYLLIGVAGLLVARKWGGKTGM